MTRIWSSSARAARSSPRSGTSSERAAKRATCRAVSQSTIGVKLESGETLLQLEHRCEEVAELLGALEHLVRLKDQLTRVAARGHALDLLPAQRGGHGGPLPGAQRVDAHGGL